MSPVSFVLVCSANWTEHTHTPHTHWPQTQFGAALWLVVKIRPRLSYAVLSLSLFHQTSDGHSTLQTESGISWLEKFSYKDKFESLLAKSRSNSLRVWKQLLRQDTIKFPGYPADVIFSKRKARRIQSGKRADGIRRSECIYFAILIRKCSIL